MKKSKVTFYVNMVVLIMAVLVLSGSTPIGCQQNMHVPVPEPSENPDPGVPPKLEKKPLPPVSSQNMGR